MINKGIDTVTSAIDYVNQSVQSTIADPESTSKTNQENQTVANPNTSFDKLKVVADEFVGIWLKEGSKGLEYLKATSAYKISDPYVNYIAKFEQVKDSSLNLKTQVEKVVSDVNQRVVLFIDEATNFVGMLIDLAKDRQAELIAYIKKTYSNVSVFVQDNWMRLDFNADGSVGLDDMRKGLSQLYEFMKTYDYIQATQQIKSTVYEEAQKYIKTSGKAGESDIPITEDNSETKEKKE